MFSNGKKTIGVFASTVYHEFQDVLSRGICKRAKELDYNVAFFTNFKGYGKIQYEEGERKIADLPRYENFNGIILLPDTMHVEYYQESIRNHIKNRCNCPVVSVRQSIEEYYNVLINDDKVLEEIIRHFIVEHGFTRLNFLTGPKDNPTSHIRVNTFERILQEYQIPVEEERIYYGDFWKFEAYDAVQYWFSNNSMEFPQAIICANDLMAIATCNALSERGIAVPGDVAISGCDDFERAKDFYPSITTAGMPIFEMGETAVDKIHKHNMGVEQEKTTYLDTVTIYRESCGCTNHVTYDLLINRRNNIINEVDAKDQEALSNAYMSIDLTSATKLDLLNMKLPLYTHLLKGYSSFYMCLDREWDKSSFDKILELNNHEIVMEVGIKEGKILPKVTFHKYKLLPPNYMDNEPQFYYFNLLHYQERCFGYTAISFKEPQSYKLSYQGWLINVCNTLENIRIHRELNTLLYKLEDMYIKDDLTSLYNRRGLEALGQKYLNQCIKKQENLMVFTADMDKMKYINDNYGHASGDIALRVIADAFMKAAEDDEICMRIGGDEFAVVGLDYNESKMRHFLNIFEGEIDRFNSLGNYTFKVAISYGWIIQVPKANATIGDYLIEADARMYQNKKSKASLEELR